MTKDIINRMQFYKFRQRLEFKCIEKNVNYNLIDESYTSKVCSICGNCKHDLGSDKIYDCSKCMKKQDRDVNGSRGIYIKSCMR